ncbi:D-2-hydroxyacid dehydrogenase [Scatolibacter rhodanostii]|uniref:D-2-hydroxyacid dehydrogenase n=1 Tax=Scatolibacter rhodanostii TaxID=2014781 RepID=UPI000C06A48A|nr:D-2-hydroxyacid dehydrogenase [Scatolibacter rhodanostii]
MNKTKKVLVTVPLKEHHLKKIEAAAPTYEFRYVKMQETTQEDVDWAEILLGNVNPNLLHGDSSIEWAQTNSAGIEGYIVPGRLHENTILSNATGAYGLAISEHMLAMLMELQKKLHLYRDAQHEMLWKAKGEVKSVYGSTILVLGMGDIGSEFAKRCKALGAYVIGMRRVKHEKPEYIDELCTPEELDAVLARADVVAISLPGTEKTRNMISREKIEKMKDGSIILNVGRGIVVDTEAMCDALESGKLWGVGLDVVEPEPLPADHRLWKLPNAVVTPHISGFYYLPETHERVIRILTENLARYYQGKELINLVNRKEGYRESVK